MRVYVASKFEEKDRVRVIQDALLAAGHVITHDWTGVTQFGQPAAVDDYNGVRTADAMVLLLDQELAYKGAWTELGIAIAHNIPVYVVGAYGQERSNIFLEMPNVFRGWNAFESVFNTRVSLALSATISHETDEPITNEDDRTDEGDPSVERV